MFIRWEWRKFNTVYWMWYRVIEAQTGLVGEVAQVHDLQARINSGKGLELGLIVTESRAQILVHGAQ